MAARRREAEGSDDIVATNVLALCMRGDQLGIAAYLEEEGIIQTQETPAFHTDLDETLERLKMCLSPAVILTTSKIAGNPAISTMLSRPVVEGNPPFRCVVAKAGDWDYQNALKTACASLRVKSLLRWQQQQQQQQLGHGGAGSGGGANGRDEEGRPGQWEHALNSLSAVVDVQCQQGMRALGALLSYLQQTTFSLEPTGDVSVNVVREVECLRSMRVDPMTLRSLSVFHEEHHPNALRGKVRSKEGFSIFGVFDRTCSAPGRRCLRQWMMKPSLDIQVISARQDGVELLSRAEHGEAAGQVRKLLRRFHDVPRHVLRIKKVAATHRDWCRLVQSIEAILAIKEALAALRQRSERPAHVAFLDDIASLVDVVSLRRCLQCLAGTLDIEATLETKELCVRDGRSRELDEMKHTFSRLPDILRGVCEVVLQENPLLDEVTVDYVPQIGFVVAVSEASLPHVPPTFEYAYAAVDICYYKSERMHELDNEVGDIRTNIADLSSLVLREMEELMLLEEPALQLAAVGMAELDAILSLASAAVDFGLVRPRVVEDPILAIKNGRHPLQSLTVDAFIPNDTYIAPPHSRIAIITGATYAGKSVYIKQVGALVLLAHVGSFLPCEKAVIGLCDRIYTRIATVESVSVPQSTFTIDTTQVAAAVRRSTPRSLLLIDEFGKGTSPTDGAALVAALVRHLANGGGGGSSSGGGGGSGSGGGGAGGSGHGAGGPDGGNGDAASDSGFSDAAIGGSRGGGFGDPSGSSSDGGGGGGGGGPKAFITTHFVDELFAPGVLGNCGPGGRLEGLEGARAYRMDVHVAAAADAAGSSGGGGGGSGGGGSGQEPAPTPLYKLVPGIAACSHGISCARIGGVPDSVLRRAGAVVESLTTSAPLPPVSAAEGATRNSAGEGGGAGGGGGGGGRLELLEAPAVRQLLKLLLTRREPWAAAPAQDIEIMRELLMSALQLV